ncbi:MAG: hypothetical protein IJ364_00675, partial [Oscillospiraceae bacterium]|nr:hypothetical protein [Oscillospiraceae bacterium]
WEYGVFDWPYCIQGLNNMIMLNNQLSFSGLLQDEMELFPLLNSKPEDMSALKQLDETYYPFNSCCQYSDQVFIVALKGFPDLFIYSPA